MHFVPSETVATPANDPLKVDNAIAACLIDLNRILYYSFHQKLMDIKYIFFFDCTMIN